MNFFGNNVQFYKAIVPQDSEAAINRIYDVMERVDQIVREAMQEHMNAFTQQMREKTGARHLDFEEPYLPFEEAKHALQFLQTLQRLLSMWQRQISAKSNVISYEEYLEALEYKLLDRNRPLLPQIEARLEIEITRLKRRLKQKLDELRQQAFGLHKYIWRSQDDDKVRASHAANDDKVFDWNNPPSTGHPGHDFGCRCSAEPTLEGAGAPKIALDDLLTILELLSLLSGLGIARKIGMMIARRYLRKNNPFGKKLPTNIGKNRSITDLNTVQRQNLARFEKKIT